MLQHRFCERETTSISTEEETTPSEGESYISDQEALRCALSIPEEFCKGFSKDPEGKEGRRMSITSGGKPVGMGIGVGVGRERRFLSPTRTRTKQKQIGDQPEFRITTNKRLLVRERERKLRSAFAKYKKWDEAEKCKVEKLENNRVRVNDDLVLERDHTNYIKETDVPMEMDEDYRTCQMPDPPEPHASVPVECEERACRLGCLCDSIRGDAIIVRGHCGKPRCFFECSCFLGGDDGDIRSRLRPRVSLLNWRFMESEREKEPPPVNYRQLERGVAIYPRMRRVPVAPQRYRNEFNLAGKLKDTFNRERRKSAAAVSIAKLIRKPGVGVKGQGAGAGNIYRRNLLKHSKQKENIPGRFAKRMACSKMAVPSTSKAMNSPPEDDGEDEESVIPVPRVVHGIHKDAMIVLLGDNRVCAITFSVTAKVPKCVIYDKDETDAELPWIYLPFTSVEETWIFYPISNLETTTFTCIPDISCIVPSKVLRLHQNIAREKKKMCALEMLFIGVDTKERKGTIYLFPELPHAMVIGPFPRAHLRTRLNPNFNRVKMVSAACNLCDSLSGESGKRTFGDALSIENFFKTKNERIYAKARANVAADEEAIKNNPVIINNLSSPDTSDQSAESSQSSDSEEDDFSQLPSSPKSHSSEEAASSNMHVTWKDAAALMTIDSD